MSSSTDVLLFATPGDPGIEALLEKIRTENRGAAPYPVDTREFSGPNPFGAAVLAYGADYWPFWGRAQKLLDSVRWKHPGAVVLIVQSEHSDVAVVYRPAFDVEQPGWGDDQVRAVQARPEVRP